MGEKQCNILPVVIILGKSGLYFSTWHQIDTIVHMILFQCQRTRYVVQLIKFYKVISLKQWKYYHANHHKNTDLIGEFGVHVIYEPCPPMQWHTKLDLLLPREDGCPSLPQIQKCCPPSEKEKKCCPPKRRKNNLAWGGLPSLYHFGSSPSLCLSAWHMVIKYNHINIVPYRIFILKYMLMKCW